MDDRFRGGGEDADIGYVDSGYCLDRYITMERLMVEEQVEERP